MSATHDHHARTADVSEAALQHPPAHRSVPGELKATLVTCAAMALYDHLDGEHRACAVVPLDDDNRTHHRRL